MNPKISIVIPFYNCPYIAEAVESALNQSYPNKEIIVVDDGSVQHVEKLTPYLPKIKYIRKNNGGTASALNEGIRNASGEYFCWLSSDDSFLPNKLIDQLAFMQKENAPASYTSFFIMDSSSQIKSPIPLGKAYPTKLQFFKQLKAGCPINGCTVMLKMSIFESLGLFDENLKYTHDYDFWMRLVQSFEIVFVPIPLTQYRVHDEMGTKKHSDAIRNEIRMVKKNHLYNIRSLIKNEFKPR